MIRNIILSQKAELEKKLTEKYITRDVSISYLQNDLIKVITGPRRSGKSFFAINELKSKVTKFGYVNFDDEKIIETKDYDDIIETINNVYEKPKHIFFDEIQNLPKWELFVNRLQRKGYHLIISGSNSNLLSSELATHLTGRYSEIKMFPFSFKEFIKLSGKELTDAEKKERYNYYAENGGFPEIYTKNLITSEYMRNLFDSVIYKDIIKRHSIRISKIIDNLALYLISNAANEFSYRNLTKIINSVSVNTVKKYIGFLEESFLFFQINRFSYKIKNQITLDKKIYSIDNGFIKSKGFSFSPGRGKVIENLVAIEMKRREFIEYSEIFFWKNNQKEEVDFIVKKGLKIIALIQVCHSTENPKTNNREIRALLKASRELSCENLIILNEFIEKTEKIKKIIRLIR